jgi:hypothetical protein
MTAQEKDRITINANEYEFFVSPLEQYWEKENNRPVLFSGMTSLQRGYFAKWLIEQGRLYLIEFYGENAFEGKVYSIDDLFPGSIDKVFADWFTGTISIQAGKKIGYSHAGIGTIFEYSTKVEIDAGCVVDGDVVII